MVSEPSFLLLAEVTWLNHPKNNSSIKILKLASLILTYISPNGLAAEWPFATTSVTNPKEKFGLHIDGSLFFKYVISNSGDNLA